MVRLLMLVTSVAAPVFWFGGKDVRSEGPIWTVGLAELIRQPQANEAKMVAISGVVQDWRSVLGLGGVQLGDDAGRQILVVGWTSLPAPETSVTITGTFRMALTVEPVQLPIVTVDSNL